MLLLVELSKEHPTLPVAEARACLRVCSGGYEEKFHNGIYVADVEKPNWREMALRMAMAFSINEVLGRSIDEFMQNLDIDGTFKVEGGSLEERKRVGEIMAKEKKAKVCMENPDVVIRLAGDFFCKELSKIDRSSFEHRRPSERPFSVPTTMHPRIARALVNLAEIKRGEKLLDPFCGTGGILIEGAMIGAKVIGIDVKEKLIEGCRKNLDFYGLQNYELHVMDMREGAFKVDAIVTDFPYGRASHLSDEMMKLYKEAIEKMAEWLKKGKKAVFGLPTMEFNREIKKYFEIEQIHPARVHKSLTRFFYVVRKT